MQKFHPGGINNGEVWLSGRFDLLAIDTFDWPVSASSTAGLPVQSGRHASTANFYSHATVCRFRAVRRPAPIGERSGALPGLTGRREPLPAEAAGVLSRA